MKNINWINLLSNVIRSIVVYPVLFILFFVILPLNVICWLVWTIECAVCLFKYLINGNFEVKETSFYCTFFATDDRWFIRLACVFLFSCIVFDWIEDFNNTLRKVKKA